MATTGKQRTNWPERLREIIRYVNLTEEDRGLIRSTGPIVRRYSDQLTTEVYDLIFEFPSAGRFFSYADGSPDPRRVKDNKDSMMQWLNYLSQAPSNDAFARYLISVSAMHRDIPIHRPGLPPVPTQFVIGTISFYQTRLIEIFEDELGDLRKAAKASVAWNKMLMVSLDILLGAYLLDS